MVRSALPRLRIAVAVSLSATALPLAATVLLLGAMAVPVAARQHYLPAGDARDPEPVIYAAGKGDWVSFNHQISEHPQLLSATRTDGTTLLQWALANRNRKAFRLLLKAGADPAQPGFEADTAVHAAAGHRDPIWLKLLLENGASPNLRNAQSGVVPLSRALIANRDKQFEMLLWAGADPNIADATGNTPLHVAAQINKPWHVFTLLVNRADPADPFLRNAQGQTFQRYLFMTEDRLLNKHTREGRQLVLDYLSIKDIPMEPGPIEPGTPPYQTKDFNLK